MSVATGRGSQRYSYIRLILPGWSITKAAALLREIEVAVSSDIRILVQV